MIPSGIGRADLLRILAGLPAGEWAAAAHAAGFESLPPPPKSEPRAARDRPAPASPVRPSPGPYTPSDLPDLPFWRIAAERTLRPEERPVDAPAWLERTKPWSRLPLADRRIAVPRPAVLAPTARQARFLRQVLATPTPGRKLDLQRLCRQFAEGRIAPHLPRSRRPVWPGRVVLIIDLSPSLRPFHTDLWGWSRLLERTLGRRVIRLLTRGGHPGELEYAGSGSPARLRLDDGTPLVILGDAGLYDPAGSGHRRWLALARHCADNGVTPILLAPCPPRLLTPLAARRFQCALLERGHPLRLVRSPNVPVPVFADADVPPEPAPVPCACEDLLAALADGAYTEPALLRRLRLLLKPRGADIGCEHEVWNHPAVVSDALACALRPVQRDKLEKHLTTLPPGLRIAIGDAREKGNRHLSPLVLLEETLAAGPRADPRAYCEALRKVRRWAKTLHQTDHAPLHQPLAAAISGLECRRSSLLVRHPELAAAWAIAHRQALDAGTLERLPAGIDLDDLGWLLSRPGQARPVYLGQQSECLGSTPGMGSIPPVVWRSCR